MKRIPPFIVYKAAVNNESKFYYFQNGFRQKIIENLHILIAKLCWRQKKENSHWIEKYVFFQFMFKKIGDCFHSKILPNSEIFGRNRHSI